MSDLIGKTLAHYEVTALVGRGGMGEVYRATDTKLGREVALKVLPPELSEDPERLARFRREARTLASLHHPRIASLFGIEEVDGTTMLAMELVEGRDLAEHLSVAGALSIDDVVAIGAQIAEGLEFAHDNGVMHRDLKPANVRMTGQGEVKLLDFGLARAFTGEPTDESDLANSPTITAALTSEGVVLGTAAYMSPEQAKGRSVDRRSDIWSYGVVLYELLVGRKLFQADTASETMAEVLKAEIDWAPLPRDTPAPLRRLLARCLDRDPSTRLRDIGEARVTLEALRTGRSDHAIDTAAAIPRAGAGRERLLWMTLLLASVAVVAGLVISRPTPEEPSLVQSTIDPPEGWGFIPSSPFEISPDGRRIAFVAFPVPGDEGSGGRNAIWIRNLDSVEARQLVTVDRNAYPFWSPDGLWIGFFSDGKLNKIESRGGPVIALCDAGDGRGGSWNRDGMIIFQREWNEGLMKIGAGGGVPEPLTVLDRDHDEILHRFPTFLPGGRQFLFYVARTTNPYANEESGIYVGSVDTGETRFLLRSESRARYAQGHILYRNGRILMACGFDPSTARLTADPTPIATEVAGGTISWGGAQFGVSESGVLVHLRGLGVTESVFAWRDRSGTFLSTAGEPDAYWEPRLSPDEKRIAVVVGSSSGDIWIQDLEGGRRTRFSFDDADERTPLWSPDGRHVLYTVTPAAASDIYMRAASGEDSAQRIYSADGMIQLTHWSNDGRYVFFNTTAAREGGGDVWVLDMDTQEATPVLDGPEWQEGASLSPDGEYLAYCSGPVGNNQVYVQSFPVASGRWMVSSDSRTGLTQRPLWRNDGREIFYQRNSTLMAVSISTENGFVSGTPEVLFDLGFNVVDPSYNISGDGRRILTHELPATDRELAGARLIQHWTRLLER